MNVQKIFREQRAVIVEGWINAVYSTYPLQTTGFLRTKNDPFTNPVGDMTKEAAGLIYDVIAGEHVTPQKIKHALDASCGCVPCSSIRPVRAWGSSSS